VGKKKRGKKELKKEKKVQKFRNKSKGREKQQKHLNCLCSYHATNLGTFYRCKSISLHSWNFYGNTRYGQCGRARLCKSLIKTKRQELLLDPGM